MHLAIAPSTQAGYQSAGVGFWHWIQREAAPVSVISLSEAVDYVVYLFDLQYCYASANKFRCWLAQEEKILLGSGRLSSDTRFLMALRGYERATLEWSTVTAPIREPAVCKLLSSDRLHSTARHMVALAYSCFLRYAEVLDVMAGYSHLKRAADGFLLHLVRSKCDPRRRGIMVHFSYREVPEFCRGYLDDISVEWAAPWEVPSRSFWARILPLFVPDGRFHGFRHGRVVDLIYAGMPKEHIMHLGRWASLTGFRHYDAH